MLQKFADPLVAPVQPNMLNMPKSISGDYRYVYFIIFALYFRADVLTAERP